MQATSSTARAGACPEVLARVAIAAESMPGGLDAEACAGLLHDALVAQGFSRAEVLSFAATLIARAARETEPMPSLQRAG